jgi:hypothetical protein
MTLANLSIPSISISLALPDDPPVEPFSPFDSQPSSPVIQEDSYRPSLLSPPVLSPRFHRQPSPLRPADTLPTGKGLDRGQFEALLASTRERNASAKKEPNLRKELALKAHKSKQSTPLRIVIFFSSCPNFSFSGTPCAISVQGQCPSFTYRDVSSENAPGVAIYLSLFLALSGPHFPTVLIRVFATRRFHRVGPVPFCRALGRASRISPTAGAQWTSPFSGTDYCASELPSSCCNGQGRASSSSHSLAYVFAQSFPHKPF